MKKLIYIIFAFITITVTITKMNAQVTIGSMSNPNVTLEIVGQPTTAAIADGVIIPRLTGNNLKAKIDAATYNNAVTFEGTLVYITEAVTPESNGTIIPAAVEYVKAPGYYYFDKAVNKWKGIATTYNATQWFYMPPVPINTETGTDKKISLYEAYKNSIEGSTATGIAVKNTNAPVFSILQPVLTASEFNYYIVGYDPKLFSNISISDTGEMTYTIAASAIADDKSYINIIFARK